MKSFNLNQIKEAAGEDWGKVEFLIRNALSSDIEIINSVNDNILTNSGKQLRPLLSLLLARACSGGHPTQTSVYYAAAVELLHNATLFHDDVADSSDERRGIPTLRALMGPTVSVLVGDFWLVKAVSLILSLGYDHVSGRVVNFFSKTLSDLVEGEMLQLQKSKAGDTAEDDCLRIIYSKTASLFETASLAAAISVAADSAVESLVGRFGRSLGMAFQIRDDILDYQSVEADLGKPVGNDVVEGLITLPLIGAFRNAPEREAEIRAGIVNISSNPEMRDTIISYVRDNGGIEYAEGKLAGYAQDALSALRKIPDGEDRRYLEEIAVYVGERKS